MEGTLPSFFFHCQGTLLPSLDNPYIPFYNRTE